MDQLFNERLQEVAHYYKSGDHQLGLRRMLDAALETRQAAIFEKTLAFCDRSETIKDEALISEALQLIESIGAAGVAKMPLRTESTVVVKGIGKSYSKGNFKLSPVDLELQPGQIAGLVGENGNGKTTLLRILAGELNPDMGEITFKFGTPARNPYEKRTVLAFVQQRIPRWWGTLTDNLHFTAAQYGLKGKENELWVEMIIARLGLRPYKALSWKSISSGYRTRFELARTLLRKPEVLLLDEPLANLDIISQQTILQDLRFLAQSSTHPMSIVLSSQQIYEVEKVSDKIVFLKQGSPIYQDLKKENTVSDTGLALFEIETTASRDELLAAFASLPLNQVQFNGGIFIATFSSGVTAAGVMNALSAASFEVSYFRNISQSSRRFFANL